jgi:diaminopimelate epimerase
MLDARHMSAEQAAFVDVANRSMRMAGNEFCVNGTRAFGALLDMERPQHDRATAEERHYEANVSGWPTPVSLLVQGTEPTWDVTALLRLPDCPIEHPSSGVHIVRLPGIVHLLIDASCHRLPEDCEAAGAQLRRQYGLEQDEASGIVWWRVCQGRLDMLPLVTVRDAGTTCLESACGSGALALALAIGQDTPGTNELPIQQPSGDCLLVRILQNPMGRMASIGGAVTLIARGHLWLPQP